MFKRFKSPEVSLVSLGIIGLLIFVPIYPKFPFFNVSGTYVAVRIEDFVIAFVLLLWFFHQLRLGFPSLKDRVGKFIMLYWLVGGLSLLSAILITKNISPSLAFLHFLRRIEYMSLFFVALASIRSVKNLKTYGGILFLATVGVIIYGLGQKFLSWPVISTMNSEFSKGMLLTLSEWARINSTFAGHYDLAAFMVMVLAVIGGFFFGFKSKKAKFGLLLIGLFALYILILTASRISFAAYLLAIAFVMLALRKYWWVGPVLALSLGMMLLSDEITQRYALTFNIDLSALSARLPKRQGPAVSPTPTLTPTPLPTVARGSKGGKAGAVLTPTPTMTKRYLEEEWVPTTELAVQYSSGIRFDVEWPRSMRAFAKNPFLGTGYSSVTLATDNDYLRLLAETGLMGFVAFFLIFLEIGRRVLVFLKKAKAGLEKSLVAGLSGAALGLLANALFIDVFESSKVAFIFWILMGSLVGLINISEKSVEVNEKK
jgi:hypothetical protein